MPQETYCSSDRGMNVMAVQLKKRNVSHYVLVIEIKQRVSLQEKTQQIQKQHKAGYGGLARPNVLINLASTALLQK